MRLNRRIGLALIVVAAAAMLPSAALGQSQTVTIRNFAFVPAGATIAPGESITWSNNDGLAHTATSDSGVFNTGSIAAGASKQITFANPGTYAYHCSIHPSMTGTITVLAQQPTPVPTAPPTPAPTAPPAPSTTPPTPVPTVPVTPAPSATAAATPDASSLATGSPSPIPSAVSPAASTPRPSLLTLASPSATTNPPAATDGPGPVLAVAVLAGAAALAGLALYLYRRR